MKMTKLLPLKVYPFTLNRSYNLFCDIFQYSGYMHLFLLSFNMCFEFVKLCSPFDF